MTRFGVSARVPSTLVGVRDRALGSVNGALSVVGVQVALGASASLSGMRAGASAPLAPRTEPQNPGSKPPMYPNSRYYVSVEGMDTAVFNEVSGLQIETETMDFVEGGVNDRVLRLPVRSKVGNITLKRGVARGNELLEWHLKIVQGILDVRNVTITVYHGRDEVVMRYSLLQAYPVRWSGPQLAAGGDTIAVETLELAHAGFLVTGG